MKKNELTNGLAEVRIERKVDKNVLQNKQNISTVNRNIQLECEWIKGQWFIRSTQLLVPLLNGAHHSYLYLFRLCGSQIEVR